VFEKGNYARFECGCEIDVKGDFFCMKACKPNCQVVQYCKEETERQGKSFLFLDQSSNQVVSA
jgi:hypothetical protein